MEEESNVSTSPSPTMISEVETTEVSFEPSPSPEETQSPEQELASLISRMQELVSKAETQQVVSQTPAIAQAINKAVEFRPMVADQRNEVEKFLMRPDGPLSRYTNVKE